MSGRAAHHRRRNPYDDLLRLAGRRAMEATEPDFKQRQGGLEVPSEIKRSPRCGRLDVFSRGAVTDGSPFTSRPPPRRRRSTSELPQQVDAARHAVFVYASFKGSSASMAIAYRPRGQRSGSSAGLPQRLRDGSSGCVDALTPTARCRNSSGDHARPNGLEATMASDNALHRGTLRQAGDAGSGQGMEKVFRDSSATRLRRQGPLRALRRVDE